MDPAVRPAFEERRRDTRFRGDALGHVRGTVRPGHAVIVIDLSRGGALVEVGRPLGPGARVHLQLYRGPRHFLVSGLVVRCAVCALGGDEGVVYRGAVQFEPRCEDLWELCSRTGYPGPELDEPVVQTVGPDVPRRLRAEGTRARE